MKRIFLFLLTNLLVITLVTVIINLFGFQEILNQHIGNYANLLIFCFIFGMSGSFVSLLLSKFLAKKSMGVHVINADPGEYQWIVDQVEIMAREAKIDMPEVGIYEAADVNAFATGASKNSSLVALSTGLIEKMDLNEIKGVISHEIAHIANGDMVTMTLLQGVLNTFVLFAARALAALLTKGDNRSGGIYFIVMIALQILFGFLASIVVAYFSRYREYRADEGGALINGKADMVAALQKLQSDLPVVQRSSAGNISAFRISNLSGIFSTHPPLEKRIKNLNELSHN